MKNSITKRIMAGIVCAMVAVSICGCSEKPAQSSASESSVTSDAGSVSESVSEASDSSTATGTAAEITAKIQEDVKFPGMAEIGADRMAFGREDLAGEVREHAADVGSRFGKIEVEFGDAVKIAAVAGKTLEHG